MVNPHSILYLPWFLLFFFSVNSGALFQWVVGQISSFTGICSKTHFKRLSLKSWGYKYSRLSRENNSKKEQLVSIKCLSRRAVWQTAYKLAIQGLGCSRMFKDGTSDQASNQAEQVGNSSKLVYIRTPRV